MKKACIFALVVACASAFAQTRYQVQYIQPLTGGEYAGASGVNDAGVIVGYSRYWPNGVNQWERGIVFAGTRPWMLANLSTQYPTSEAYDINNHGDVVGFAENDQRNYQALLWLGGRTLVALTPPGIGAQAYSINDSGQVVGQVGGPAGTAFLYHNGVLTFLPKLVGDGYHYGAEINESGLIVGGSARKAVFWQSGALNIIPLPAGGPWHYAGAGACNDQGQIVGYVTSDGTQEDPSAARTFIYSNGRTKLLPFTEGSFAADINNQGTIIGRYVYLPAGIMSKSRPYVYEAGVRYDLNNLIDNLPAGMTVGSATAISETGIISGSIYDSSGKGYPAVFTPVP